MAIDLLNGSDMDETIHSFVTRPIVPIVDDGQGNFNISPLGFPRVNVSDGMNPTRVTPEFLIGYNNVVDSSSRLVLSYTENNVNIVDLYGTQVRTLSVTSLTRSGSTVTAVTNLPHGYVTDKVISISGALIPDYNGDKIITVTGSNQFTYTIDTTPATPASGVIYSTYTIASNDVVRLIAQNIDAENGYYVATANTWRELYVQKNMYNAIKVRTNTNVDLGTAGLFDVVYDVVSITREVSSSGRYYGIVSTDDENGFATGNIITVTGSSVSTYNGSYIIEKLSATKFRYELSTDPLSDDLSGTSTVIYNITDNDLVYVASQTDESEIGLYKANSGSWEFYGFFYQWDGTENDNVAGNYGDDVDQDGNPITHYRKGYSLAETESYLRDRLNISIQFGKYAGSHRELGEHGAFVQWLLSGRKVNIGGSSTDKHVFIDGFGLSNPESAKKSQRVIGPVDVTNATAVNEKRIEISRQNKFTVWGLTNHHSNALKGFFNKSPFVKDYPFIYNSEYQNTNDPYDYLTAGHLPADVDAERWRMSITGTSTSTNTNVRPMTVDMLWYHRDNSYHNNITLDVTNPNIHGRHSMSIINNFNVPDSIALFEQEFSSSDITSPDVITVPDVSHWMVNDLVQFKFPEGTTKPTGISEYTTYVVGATSTGNTLQLTDMAGDPINIIDTGIGTFTIQRHVFDIYNNDEVVDALDDMASIEFITGNVLVYKTITTSNGYNVIKYYIKPRKKGSLGIIEPKGSWTEDTLSFDGSTPNSINIYLNASETEYITFTHPTFSTEDLWEELNEHTDMIPVPFDPSTTDLDSLTVLFVHNTRVDYTSLVHKSNKIRSKKTFVHLPTPIGLPDGTPFEIDISLPVIPDTNSFSFNTLGSISGYKNYVTQPRVYVLSGYQQFECTNISVASITHNDGNATVTTLDDHGIYTATFDDSSVNVNDNTITISNWKDISIGDNVRFKNVGGALPEGIDSGIDYSITYNELGRIKIGNSGVNVDITSAAGGGIHSIVVLSALKIDISGSLSDYYNDQFNGTVTDFNKISIEVNTLAPSPAPGAPYINRVVTVTGSNGAKGLTERYNANIFSPMPEVEFATESNVYHQTFDTVSLYGNNKNGVNRDIRVLLATIYPTTTSTFAWRIDNDPTLRMLPWSIMNITALGGNESTGSFANVAYERNKSIFNEFPAQFKESNDGLFSVYDNSISYVDTGTVAFTQQQLNGKIRIKYPYIKGMSLSDDEIETVGSFNYQAERAYVDLMNDFLAGRVRVESRTLNPGTLGLLDYANGYPDNHGVSGIPTSFYDQTSGSEFLKFDVIQNTNDSSNESALNRWTTSALYLPSYVVNAENSTLLPNSDPFMGADIAFKTHLSQYFISGADRESNAGNRHIYGDLTPSSDPSFEFAVGSSHKFIDFLITNSDGTESENTVLNDIRRRFWDSFYSIPNAAQRQIQNAYHINTTSTSIEDIAKFHGSQWIPFAKVFSPDAFVPLENELESIADYGVIIADDNLNATFNNAIASNPIAVKFKNNGYVDSYASINSHDDNSDLEEFVRNYVAGYSNHMPFRHYNGFRIAVSGDVNSTQYVTDLDVDGVNTETDMNRIYQYSVRDYLTEYLSSPSSAVGQYLDDHFMLKQISGENIIAEDPNASWWYFENGNPLTDSVNSTIKDLINVSGMNYLADRDFYQSKMKYAYTRIKMSFVFSAKTGRWLTLDYRQIPTSYLTPTFGAQALRERESTIESDGSDTDYIWKYPVCLDPYNVFKEAESIPYWEMEPMKLNPSCYSYMSAEFPYVDNTLVDELNYERDMQYAESYRFTRLIEPNAASPAGINFVVPSNMHGTDPSHSLFLYQPHMWKVYWHMRPVVCAMEGTDIPSMSARTGGEMSDPFLNNMFCYPDARNPQYYIPWHENMNNDWLNSGWLLIDAKIDDPDGNADRDLYTEIDSAYGDDPERDNYWEIESSNVSLSDRMDAINDLE